MFQLVAFHVEDEGDLGLPEVRKRVLATIRAHAPTGAKRGWQWTPWPNVPALLALLGASLSERQKRAKGWLMAEIDAPPAAMRALDKARKALPYPLWIMTCRDPVVALRAWYKVEGARLTGQKPNAAHLRRLRETLQLV